MRYEVSDDPSRLDIDTIHGFLRTAYSESGVSRETVERAAAGSLPMGLYAPDGAQAGYAVPSPIGRRSATWPTSSSSRSTEAVGCRASSSMPCSTTRTSRDSVGGCSPPRTRTASTRRSASTALDDRTDEIVRGPRPSGAARDLWRVCDASARSEASISRQQVAGVSRPTDRNRDSRGRRRPAGGRRSGRRPRRPPVRSRRCGRPRRRGRMARTRPQRSPR